MTNSTFPVSFKDPVYADADVSASNAVGIPPGLLSSIRLAGEKSNANQTSSAGATTPYQFTPDTRARLIDKYGIDPTASPQAAALGAAYILKEGIQRTGSAAGAVTQYIGGTDPANWGGNTRAYTNRVMAAFTKSGGQDAPQAQATPTPTSAALPSAASYGLDPTVVGLGGAAQPIPQASVAPPPAAAPAAGVNSQIISDYNSGRLSPSDMDAIDQRVADGKIDIPPGQLIRPQVAPGASAAPAQQPKQIGPKTLAAIQAGTLSQQDLKTVQDGIANGTLAMPPQAAPTAPAAAPPPAATADTDSRWNPLGGVPSNSMPTAPQNPQVAAQNGSTLSDVAEKGVGGVVGGLLDIAGAGGRLVGATDFANGAQQAHQQLDAKIAADTNGSLAGKVAGVVGGALPYATAGGASIPGAVLGGAAAGAVPAIAADKSGLEVAKNAAIGAGFGAAGAQAGKYAGSAISSLLENPTIAKGIQKAQQFFGGTPSAAAQAAASGAAKDASVAADLASAAGHTPDSLATKLEQGAPANTPGYTPSAAELAGDANVTTLQKASTNANPEVAANAAADNDKAIAGTLSPAQTPNPGSAANPQAAEAAAEAVAQHSDVLAAQGASELPPISSDIAQTLQAPQYEAPIKLARRIAADEGSTVFSDLDAAKQTAAADTLKQIIGTPEQLDAMKSARGAKAADDYLSTKAAIPVDTPEIQALLAKPAMKKALSAAQETAQNSDGAPIFTQGGKAPLLVGSGKQAPTKYISGQGLVAAKSALDDQIGAAARAGETGQVSTLTGVKNKLLSYLDTALPDYGKARDNYRVASGPIDAMQSVQSRLYSAVDPATGEVAPGKLISAINSIKGEQMKPGIRPADKVPPETMDALAQLATHLQNKSDLTGLPGEGQEYIRRALASSDKHADAYDQFKGILDKNSPAFKELHGSHVQMAESVDSVKRSQYALAQAQDAIAEADSPGGLKRIDKLLSDMEPADASKAVALRQQKAQELAMADVQSRNLNSRGETEFNRGTFNAATEKYGPYMAPADAAKFSSVAQDLHRQTTNYAKTGKISGSDTAQNQNVAQRSMSNIGEAFRDRAVQSLIGASIGSVGGIGGSAAGAAVGVIAPAVMRAVTNKVSAISTENAAKLLSNGKMLAAALRNYESLAARRAFVNGLSQKLGFAAGVSTGNAFSNRSGQ